MSVLNTEEVQRRIGYKFKNVSYLTQAFVHSSYANAEHIDDNERMEFLGDAILDTIVAEYLYERYPHADAGELSKMRSLVVSADGLRPVVDKLGILGFLLVASGARKIRTISRKIEANLYEAVLCAIYFDGGWSAAKRFVLKTLAEPLNAIDKHDFKDYKTIVQEYCQERRKSVSYKREKRTGPDNSPTFTCSLWIDGRRVSDGVGSSVKAAEQVAASKIVKEWRID